MYKPALAALLVASCFSPAYAEDIEHISVYANRIATAETDVLASLTVLNRDDIVERQAVDLPALLAQLPGINVARSGGRGQLSSVFIRGGEAKHTLVLIDGVRTGSATAGAKSLSMLPLELIEQIEIIRGPRAALYGADAMAGVIAITTRRPSQLEVNVAAGSYGQASSDVHLSHQQGDLQLKASFGASQADGFNVQPALDPDKDGYDQKYVKLAADYQTALGTWSVQADVVSGSYQFDTSWGDEDQSDTLNRTYLLGWHLQAEHWLHQVQLNRLLDSDTTFGPQTRNPFVTARDELNYQSTTELSENLNLLAGFNWYQENVDKSITVYDKFNRTNRAVFTGFNYQQQAFSLDTAIRRDDASEYGINTTWQLAVGYQITEQWLVRANRGTSFKAPSFNDLYFPGFSNPNLRPEKSKADELAVSYNSEALNLSLAWFNRDVTDLIQFVVSQPENVAQADIQGIELSVDYQWQQLSQSLAYTWLDARDDSTNLRLLLRPENSVNWRGSYAAGDFSAFITVDYQSRTRQPFDWSTGANFPDAASFTVWGAGFGYQLSDELVVRAKVDNLFNKDYYTNHGYATAGVNVGISLSFIPVK